MWHISERTFFNQRAWKTHGAAAEPMSGWGWRVQLEILAGLMAYVMKDWIRTGTWNKTAWDYLLEDLELTCDNQLPMEHKLPVWPPGLRGWAGTLTGPAKQSSDGQQSSGTCREELIRRVLQCSESEPAETAACWGGTEAFSSTSVVLHGRWQPELPRIIHQMNVLVEAEDEWANNLKAERTLTDFKLRIDTQSHVLSETAFVVLKRESHGVEGEQGKLLAFLGVS